MSLVAAKCTECGGAVQVDSEKKAAICESCGNAFIVEDAISNFNNQFFVTNEISDSVVNIIGGDSGTLESYEKRAWMYLESGEWGKAEEYFDRVLDINPEYAPAYLGKLMRRVYISEESRLSFSHWPFRDDNNFKKAMQFGDRNLRERLERYASGAEAKAIQEKRCKHCGKEKTINIQGVCNECKKPNPEFIQTKKKELEEEEQSILNFIIPKTTAELRLRMNERYNRIMPVRSQKTGTMFTRRIKKKYYMPPYDELWQSIQAMDISQVRSKLYKVRAVITCPNREFCDLAVWNNQHLLSGKELELFFSYEWNEIAHKDFARDLNWILFGNEGETIEVNYS
jgi:tetratricopeptide (TPR) repeat protein